MLDLIQWRASKAPETPALFFNGRWYSYRELDGRANRLANRLLSLGVRAGDRVGVLARNHPVHLDLLLAAPKIGIVFAPFNPSLPEVELQAAAQVAKPALIFADSRYHRTAAAIGSAWTRLSEYRDWLSVGSLNLPPPPSLSVDAIHCLLPTAQGWAALPYRQVLLNARHAADAWGLSTEDTTVHCLGCHGPELHLLCLPLLYRGGRIVLMSAFEPDEYLGYLSLHRATVAALTPQMLRQVAEYRDFDGANLSSLNWVASVGAQAPVHVRRLWRERGVKLPLLVPQVAAGPNLFHVDLEQTLLHPDLLGRPLPDVQLPDSPGATAAELRVAGPMVFGGYKAALEQCAVAAVPESVSTGLVVQCDAEGSYHYRGHADEVIATAAGAVHPGEIESALMACEDVVDCAVIADPAEAGRVLAVLVLADDCELDAQKLNDTLGACLSPEKLPQCYHQGRVVPRNAWGRIDRAAVLATVQQARQSAERAPA